LEKVASTLRYYLSGIYRELHNKDIFLWAQAIAFKVLVTFVPLVVLGTGLAGKILQRERPFRYVEALIRDFFPAFQSDQLVRFLSQLQLSAGTLTLIGSIGLILTAVTLFATLRSVLANIFREEWHEHRSLWRAYAFDIRMALQVGLLFVLSITITIMMRTLNASGIEFLQSSGFSPSWLRAGWQDGFRLIGLTLPFLLSIAMFFLLFFFTPKPHPPKRSALTGAFVAALLWELAKIAFTLYATRAGGFQRSWMSALGDTFVLSLAFVFWAYYSGIVLNIGAISTLLHERKHRNGLPTVEAIVASVHESDNQPQDAPEQ
jgi:membrane protein